MTAMKKVFLYIALMILVSMMTFITRLADYDLWHRLAVGSIFFQTGSVFKQDIFSYLPTKALWIDHEWASGVVFYFLTAHFGDAGLFALKAFILLGIFLLIIKVIQLRAQTPPVGVLFLMFLAFSLLPFIANMIRCQMFTYLFFALWLYLLERMRQGNNKLLWLFPVTMLLWVNTHGGFLAGIGLIVIYGFGELLNRRNALKYFLVLAVILPVTLINPYGLTFWQYIIEASLMPRPHIPEWHAIRLDGPFHIIGGQKIHVYTGFLIFTGLTALAAVRAAFKKQTPDWTYVLLSVILLYLGFRHQRHAVFFILAASVLFYHHYVSLFSSVKDVIMNSVPESLRQKMNYIGHGAVYLFLGLTFVYVVPHLSARIVVDPVFYPVGSLEFIKQNNISGNLATTYGWGSYALWKLYPQCKVMIDGRYEQVYPNDIFTAAIRFSEREGDWQEIFRQHRTDIIVLPKKLYTPEDVLRLPGWMIAYEDMSSAVLLPKDNVKSFYLYPDYHNPVYWREDLSRAIPLT